MRNRLSSELEEAALASRGGMTAMSKMTPTATEPTDRNRPGKVRRDLPVIKASFALGLFDFYYPLYAAVKPFIGLTQKHRGCTGDLTHRVSTGKFTDSLNGETSEN